MRPIFIIICLIFFGCTKEDTLVPQLEDKKPLVYKISSDNGGSPYYVFYKDSLITRIYHNELTDTVNLERTDFYYTGSRLDSAIKVDKFAGDYMTAEVFIYKFSYNSNGQVFLITQNSNYNQQTVSYYLRYEGYKLTRLSCKAFIDSIVYDSDGNFSSCYTTHFPPYMGLIKTKSSIHSVKVSDRPYPYRVIENQLGYPFFRASLWPLHNGLYSDNFVSEYYTNGQESLNCSLGFEYDKKGRIVTQYDTKNTYWRTRFEYY